MIDNIAEGDRKLWWKTLEIDLQHDTGSKPKFQGHTFDQYIWSLTFYQSCQHTTFNQNLFILQSQIFSLDTIFIVPLCPSSTVLLGRQKGPSTRWTKLVALSKLGPILLPSCCKSIKTTAAGLIETVSGGLQGMITSHLCFLQEFYLKCAAHPTCDNDTSAALDLIMPNTRRVPCIVCTDITWEALGFSHLSVAKPIIEVEMSLHNKELIRQFITTLISPHPKQAWCDKSTKDKSFCPNQPRLQTVLLVAWLLLGLWIDKKTNKKIDIYTHTLHPQMNVPWKKKWTLEIQNK